MKTQEQLYYEANSKQSEADKLFLFFVEDGLTKSELQENIRKNPSIWSKYRKWIEKLPEK